MSLKEFKQTLLSCSSKYPSSTVETSQTQDRRPPKSNLKDQIASIERLAEDLECTPLGEALPTLVSLPPLPSRRNRKVLGSGVSSQIVKTDSQSRDDIGQQNVQAGLNDNFSEINYANPPPKRTRLSDYAELVTDTEFKKLHLSTSFPKISQIMRTGLEESKDNSNAEICKDRVTEDSGSDWHEQVTTIQCERSHSHDLSTFHVEDERQIDMEEDNQAINVGDSEAGLFIQSETDGLYEPLILWPPNGEGSSTGAGVVQVPASINSRLLEHQREGVKFLYHLFRENRGGVLGDDMGLGKTIQVIAFLAAILQSGHHDDGVLNQERLHKLASNQKPVLIICPTSVLRNWEQEFHAWGAFDVAIYHGIHRELVLKRLESGNLEILLTSFDTFRLHGDCLCVVDWHCVIADEAHRLKNEKSDLYKVCFKIPTKRRFGLTGTIMQNKIMDLFNLFDWVAPGCLGTREHFREFYDEPLKQGQRISAPEKFIQVAEQRRFHLAKVLQRYLLRRAKHETIGHLMMGKEDNVVFCAMSPLQQRVYKRLLSSPDFQCLTRKDEKCSCGSPLTRAECCYRIVPNGFIWPYLHKERPDGCDYCPYCLVLPCLTKLQQVSNHLELIKSNSKDDIEKQKKDEALAEFVLGQDAGLVGGTTQDESFLGLSDSQHCGKMRSLELLLAQWMPQGDKALLFSYSVRMLDILNKFLIRKGYCFSRLDGSTPMSMRQTLVDDFNRSPSKKVFLISTRAGGLGLNLVSANRVVVFDPNWNPAQDLQAQDRSFRYGQRRHVTVFRLLAAGSLEELVYNRQIYKQQLFNIAVSGNLEKRYFEGVQDSKENKGELFGISNLFRDLSDKAFTSKIIDGCSHGKGGRLAPEKGAKGGSDGSLVDGAQLRLAPAGAGQEEKYTRDEIVKQKCCVKQSSLDGLAHVLQDAGVVYAHRNEDVVNYQARIKKDDDAVGRVVCWEKQSVNSGVGLLQQQNSSRTVHATNKASTSKKENEVLKEIGSRKLNKIGGAKRTSIVKNIFSKEEQFDSLANFKGMNKPAFCKWLLSASELERQKLLLDFKQGRKTVPA